MAAKMHGGATHCRDDVDIDALCTQHFSGPGRVLLRRQPAMRQHAELQRQLDVEQGPEVGDALAAGASRLGVRPLVLGQRYLSLWAECSLRCGVLRVRVERSAPHLGADSEHHLRHVARQW